jgi:putative restriction endonuclease
MNRSLQYYDYSRCFAFYTERIMSIRQAKIQGEVIVAKPVLMLALIDGIDEGVFTANSFALNEWLEARFLKLMLEYTRQSQFAKPTDINNPFWHLSTDGFWHLQLKSEADKSTTPSKSWLKQNVSNAYFDDDLWVLLQNKQWRTKLREYIVEHKLSDNHWLRRLSEGLASLAAVLMVA